MMASPRLLHEISQMKKRLAFLQQLAENPPELPPGMVVIRARVVGRDWCHLWVVVPSDFQVCQRIWEEEDGLSVQADGYKFDIDTYSETCQEEAVYLFLHPELEDEDVEEEGEDDYIVVGSEDPNRDLDDLADRIARRLRPHEEDI